MFLDVENKQGIRYRVREGCPLPFLPQAFAQSNVDLQLLLSFDETTIEQIYHKFLFFEQQFPDPTDLRYRDRHEGRHPMGHYAGALPGVTGRRRDIYRALADQRLIIAENPLGDDVLEEEQSALAAQIRRELQQIIAQERAEAARIQREHQQRSFLGKAGAYIKRGAEGFGQATWALGIWVKDVLEVSAVISPARQVFAAANATAGYFLHGNPLEGSGRKYLANVKREVVDHWINNKVRQDSILPEE
ncbi:hypothetical protein [Microbulbifer rhizosphaerae]|uniref:Uncharacterized protein n=1 Tax=Microbulbifer rhizosphaerae TaxID=1562603 RepID=A0A7W4WBC0_9GAMM|nr:hypothetical protein [Microbulbifer rhizosphaerae]MBB3060939.1 hypothetical protein [Microbulbifer rhizosphaerae]